MTERETLVERIARVIAELQDIHRQAALLESGRAISDFQAATHAVEVYQHDLEAS